MENIRFTVISYNYLYTSTSLYNETFSPVVRHSTLRLLIALSVDLNLDIYHLDVARAFLHGILEETVFMRQPEGFIKPGEENKSIKT